MVRCALLFALLVLPAGCGPSQSAIEASMRTEMKKSLGVQVSAINLSKQPDGSYTGTASAANGDVYDLSAKPLQGKGMELKMFPGQAMLEKQFREQIKTQGGAEPTVLALSKAGGVGEYTGTATLPNGKRLTLRTFLQGNQVMSEIKNAN